MFRNCSICSISFHTYISGNLLHTILKANSDFVKVPSHWLTYNSCLYVKVYIPELSQYKMKLFTQGSISEVSSLWIITTWDISVPGASLLNAAEWCYMVKFLLFFSSVSYLRCFSLNSGNRRRANAWTLHIPWLDWSAFLTEVWLCQKTTDRRQSELAGELGECQLHGGRHNQAWKSWESSWRRGDIKVLVGNWYCYLLAAMVSWMFAVSYCTVTVPFPLALISGVIVLSDTPYLLYFVWSLVDGDVLWLPQYFPSDSASGVYSTRLLLFISLHSFCVRWISTRGHSGLDAAPETVLPFIHLHQLFLIYHEVKSSNSSLAAVSQVSVMLTQW